MKALQPRQVGVVVYLMQNLRLRGRPPPIIFARIVTPNECPTTLSLTVFIQRNFIPELLLSKCDFKPKTSVLLFRAPLWGLRDNVRVHLGLIRKRVMDFILVLIKLFSLGVTVEALRTKIDRKSAISL